MLEKNPHFAERWTSSPPQPHTFHVNVINDDASRRPPPTAEGARQRRGDKRSKRLGARTRPSKTHPVRPSLPYSFSPPKGCFLPRSPIAFPKQVASTSSMPRPKRGGRGGDVVFLVWELLFGASFLPVQIATSGTTDCRKQHGTWDAKLAAYCLWMLMGIPVHMGTVCHWISQVGVVTTGVGGRGRQPFYNYAMSCNFQCLPLDLEQTQQTMCGTDAGNKTSNCQLKLTWLQCRYCVALQ
jgi:hypothetical protein